MSRALPLLLLVACEGFEVDLRASAEVASDANGDGVLNPGERADVVVRVRNDGGADATAGRCAVVSEDAGVTIEEGAELSWYGCPGDSDCGSGRFSVEVAADAADGAEVAFRCEHGDGTIRFTLPVRVTSARPVVAAVEVVGDGNGDGVLNPGERARLRVSLRNEGAAAITQSRCAVSSDTPLVRVDEAADELGFYRCDAQADCGRDEVSVEVAEDAPAGTVAHLACPLVDKEENLFEVAFAVRVLPGAGRLVVDAVEGTLAPGERRELRVTVRNAGVVAASAYRCEVNGPGVDAGAELSWYRCDAGADCGRDRFSAQLPADSTATSADYTCGALRFTASVEAEGME